MNPQSTPEFWIDTSSLIRAFRDDVYRSEIERLAKECPVKAPPSVLTELREGGDQAYDWVSGIQSDLIYELPDEAAILTGDLVEKYEEPFRDSQNPGRTYPPLVKRGGADEADPELLALARTLGGTIVTEETRGGLIGASKNEGIECISVVHLITLTHPRLPA